MKICRVYLAIQTRFSISLSRRTPTRVQTLKKTITICPPLKYSMLLLRKFIRALICWFRSCLKCFLLKSLKSSIKKSSQKWTNCQTRHPAISQFLILELIRINLKWFPKFQSSFNKKDSAVSLKGKKIIILNMSKVSRNQTRWKLKE